MDNLSFLWCHMDDFWHNFAAIWSLSLEAKWNEKKLNMIYLKRLLGPKGTLHVGQVRILAKKVNKLLIGLYNYHIKVTRCLLSDCGCVAKYSLTAEWTYMGFLKSNASRRSKEGF